jgi:hypothetical protein
MVPEQHLTVAAAAVPDIFWINRCSDGFIKQSGTVPGVIPVPEQEIFSFDKLFRKDSFVFRFPHLQNVK